MFPFQVLFEDNHLLIINKPPGMLVQLDDTGDTSLLDHGKDYIKEKYGKPGAVFLEAVHRIDRPASGIVILARTSKGLERMNKLFREKEIEKTYLAITERKPEQENGHLIHWLVKDRGRRKSFVYEKEIKGSLKAELSYKVVHKLENKYLWQIRLFTGRPHQIRAQLAAIGCPIYGDLKYGAEKTSSDGNLCLHSWQVSFTHPVKNQHLSIIAPLFDTPEWQLFSIFAKSQNNELD